ncbi:hypothetical protein EI555_009135, partial [Monodon monoceros]
GAGVPEWNHVSGKEQLAGSGWGRGSAQRPERFAHQDPAWCEGSAGPRRGGPGAPRSADPAPGQRSRAEPPAPPGRAAARAPRSSVPIPRAGTQTRDSRGSSRGDLGPASVWRPDPEGGRWPRGHGRARRVEALGVGTPWAAALAPTAPTWAARITSVMPAPPLARPRVSPGPGLGRGAGVGLRGRPRVRGVRGHELPPLPVVPERPRPPPPYYGAAPAGPRRPPPRARPLAPQRPEPPPGPRRRRRPPFCALFSPCSASPAFVCPQRRPRSPSAPHRRPSALALTILAKPAAPSARSGQKQGPELEDPRRRPRARGESRGASRAHTAAEEDGRGGRARGPATQGCEARPAPQKGPGVSVF